MVMNDSREAVIVYNSSHQYEYEDNRFMEAAKRVITTEDTATLFIVSVTYDLH
jgi:hypothetical protein